MKHPPRNTIRRAKIGPLLLASIVANALLIAAVGYYFLGGKSKSTGGYGLGSGGGSKDSVPPAAGTVEALGRLQPSGGLISVFGPPGDKIVKFNVAVGETVPEEKILAQLAGEDERNLNLATLTAQIREAEALKKTIEASREAKLADLDAEAKQSLAGIEQDLAIIDAKIRVIDAQKARAEMELKRLTEAKAEGVNISEQEFEALRIQLVMADGEKAGATAQKEKIVILKEQSGKSIEAKKASLKAETERALAQVPGESLQAGKRLAERKLQDGQLRAPTAGRVLRILAKPGDTLTNQPVLQLANTAKMSVLVEVYETDVGRLREWLKKGPVAAEIDGRALGETAGDKGKLQGTVTGTSKISTVIARNALTPLGPREDADRRVVEVEVDLDAASSKAAETFIGLQVRVRFEPPK